MSYAPWFYRVGATQLGPVPRVELQQMIARGQIGPSVALWTDGMSDWMPASHVPGFMPSEQGLQFLVPTARTSASAMASGYLGIFGFFFPPFGIAALVLGILGVRDLKKHPEKNGWGRAITGIVLGGLLTLGTLVLVVLIALGK
jgi:hypothetical protein